MMAPIMVPVDSMATSKPVRMSLSSKPRDLTGIITEADTTEQYQYDHPKGSASKKANLQIVVIDLILEDSRRIAMLP